MADRAKILRGGAIKPGAFKKGRLKVEKNKLMNKEQETMDEQDVRR